MPPVSTCPFNLIWRGCDVNTSKQGSSVIRIHVGLVLLALVGIVSVAAFLENPDWVVRMTFVAAPVAAWLVLADARKDKGKRLADQVDCDRLPTQDPPRQST